MQKSYPGINPSISLWKGQEITDFQEELLIKVNAHLSEKWFYNHFKTENKSLPRIDILNLLSKYVAYANWDDFVHQNKKREVPGKFTTIKKANSIFILVPLLLIVVMSILFLIFKLFSTREYGFSFYDAHTRESIVSSQIEVNIISENESPINYFSDTNGCLSIKTDQSVIKMIVSAPYYKTDTITRILKTFDGDQKISLEANDYALIIHYFSVMNVDDWQKRRKYLAEIFDEAAVIYQVLNEAKSPGMELYNKTEFIDKLTMPTSTLKHIEILDTKFKAGKIMLLRFRVNK